MAKKIRKIRKKLKSDISEALVTTLSKLLDGMNEKKFARNIRRASKILIEDFDIAKANAAQQSQTKATF